MMPGDTIRTRLHASVLKTALGGSLVLILLSSPAVAVPTYTVTDLGSLGDGWSVGFAVNNNKIVVGVSANAGQDGAFLHNGTSMTNIGSLGGSFNNVAFGLSSNGQVTGKSNISGNTAYHAFHHDGSSMIDLGTLGGLFSEGRGINASGQVTGWSRISGNAVDHAFRYDGVSMIDLGTLGGAYSDGWAINDSGQIVGYSQVTGNSAFHAFLDSGSGMVDLGTLGGGSSFAYAISDTGKIAGASQITGNATQHAFLYDGTNMIDLGTLGGGFSAGYGINESGQVVGMSNDASSSSTRAFLHDGTGMYDLNGLIDLNDPLYGMVLFDSAWDINDFGDVVANGCYTSGDLQGHCRAFLLDSVALNEVPEPATVALLGASLLGLGAVRRKFRRAA